jgi:hypothetical protein
MRLRPRLYIFQRIGHHGAIGVSISPRRGRVGSILRTMFALVLVIIAIYVIVR